MSEKGLEVICAVEDMNLGLSATRILLLDSIKVKLAIGIIVTNRKHPFPICPRMIERGRSIEQEGLEVVCTVEDMYCGLSAACILLADGVEVKFAIGIIVTKHKHPFSTCSGMTECGISLGEEGLEVICAVENMNLGCVTARILLFNGVEVKFAIGIIVPKHKHPSSINTGTWQRSGGMGEEGLEVICTIEDMNLGCAAACILLADGVEVKFTIGIIITKHKHPFPIYSGVIKCSSRAEKEGLEVVRAVQDMHCRLSTPYILFADGVEVRSTIIIVVLALSYQTGTRGLC